jgi:hypothetical protein
VPLGSLNGEDSVVGLVDFVCHMRRVRRGGCASQMEL